VCRCAGDDAARRDRRRICRERESDADRIGHVNRIKGLAFLQGIGDYERCAGIDAER